MSNYKSNKANKKVFEVTPYRDVEIVIECESCQRRSEFKRRLKYVGQLAMRWVPWVGMFATIAVYSPSTMITTTTATFVIAGSLVGVMLSIFHVTE